MFSQFGIEFDNAKSSQMDRQYSSLSKTLMALNCFMFYLAISAGNSKEKDSPSTNHQLPVLNISPSDESFSTYTDANLSKHSILTNGSVSSNLIEEAPDRTVDSLEEEVSKMKSDIENLRNELRMVRSQKESLENELCLLKEKSSH